jgi:cellulose synthase/poly-beta-1,6-N-acetylglucosamine synthase-like glycosyltransferase
MDTALFLLALGTLLVYLALGFEVIRGNRSIRFLKEVPPLTGPFPRVSIVIPARNEERNLEGALLSVLAQDYPDLEFIVVDDRSTDRTGEILDRMASADPRLRVVHVTELPPGWMGKNHALHLGSESASGEHLLFTDADVVLEPSAVRRAVGFLVREGLDHMTVSPEVERPSVLFEMFIGAFSFFFALYVKPWKARDPESAKHVGIGAFNLVRAAAWRAAGGHRAIALRPDDDLKLGKLLKKNGFRQDFLFGREMVRVEWYASVRELILGTTKNSFAAVDYRLWVVVASTIAQLALNLWPFLGLVLTDGPARLLNAATVLLILLLCAVNAPLAGVRRWHGLGYPVASLLFLFILWRSTLVTLWTGGIDWRGTHYPLAELKANRV